MAKEGQPCRALVGEMERLSLKNEKAKIRLHRLERLLAESKNQQVHLMFSKASIQTMQIRKRTLIRDDIKSDEQTFDKLSNDDPAIPIVFQSSENNVSLKLSEQKLEQYRLDIAKLAEEGDSKDKIDSRYHFLQALFFFSRLETAEGDPYQWRCVYLTQEEYLQNFPRFGDYFVPFVVKLCFGHDEEVGDNDKVLLTRNLIAPAMALIIKEPFDIKKFQPILIGFVEVEVRTKDGDFAKRFISHIEQLYSVGRILTYCIHDTSEIFGKIMPEKVSNIKTKYTNYFTDIFEKGMKNIQEAFDELSELMKRKSDQLDEIAGNENSKKSPKSGPSTD